MSPDDAQGKIKKIVNSAKEYEKSVNNVQRQISSCVSTTDGLYKRIPGGIGSPTLVKESIHSANEVLSSLRSTYEETKQDLFNAANKANAEIKQIVDEYNSNVDQYNERKDVVHKLSKIPYETVTLSNVDVVITNLPDNYHEYNKGNIEIDFNLADSIINSFGSLNKMYESFAASCKNIANSAADMKFLNESDGNAVQKFANQALGFLTDFSSFFSIGIAKYREEYLKTSAEVNNVEYIKGIPYVPNYKKGNDYIIYGTTLDGTRLLVEFDGDLWYTANSSINVFDYREHLLANGIYQNNNGFGAGECMVLTQYQVCDQEQGTLTSRDAIAHGTAGFGPAVRINRKITDEYSPLPVLEFIFNELNSARETALQVNGNKHGNRHWVSFQGYRVDVTSYDQLVPENMLVLDCFNARVSRLSKCGKNEQGRYVANVDGIYYAVGATDAMIRHIENGGGINERKNVSGKK